MYVKVHLVEPGKKWRCISPLFSSAFVVWGCIFAFILFVKEKKEGIHFLFLLALRFWPWHESVAEIVTNVWPHVEIKNSFSSSFQPPAASSSRMLTARRSAGPRPASSGRPPTWRRSEHGSRSSSSSSGGEIAKHVDFPKKNINLVMKISCLSRHSDLTSTDLNNLF